MEKENFSVKVSTVECVDIRMDDADYRVFIFNHEGMPVYELYRQQYALHDYGDAETGPMNEQFFTGLDFLGIGIGPPTKEDFLRYSEPQLRAWINWKEAHRSG